jgi:hypothetical protein
MLLFDKLPEKPASVLEWNPMDSIPINALAGHVRLPD